MAKPDTTYQKQQALEKAQHHRGMCLSEAIRVSPSTHHFDQVLKTAQAFETYVITGKLPKTKKAK